MSGTESTATFVKGAFYKACFCLGLGTATYYSYAQVQTWTGNGPVGAISKNSAIQEKVDALQAAPQVIYLPSDQNPAAQNAVPPRAGAEAFRPNPQAYLKITEKEAPKPEAVLVAPAPDALAAVSPSPAASASPGAEATAENKDVKEAKEGDPANPAEPNTAAAPLAVMQPAAVIPPAQMAAFGYPINAQAESQAAVETNPNPTNYAYAGGVNSNVLPQNYQNSNVPQSSLIPASAPVNVGGIPYAPESAGASIGTQAGNTSYTPTAAPIYVSVTPSPTPVGFLSQADLALLSNPVKAAFADQTEDAAGLLCTAGAQENTVQDCAQTNHFSIHSSRWSTTEGLADDASFILKSTSASSQLEVSFTFKVQNLLQTYQTFAASAVPSEVLVHSEVKDGKKLRVFELRFPDLNPSGEALTKVVATLVYQVTDTGSTLTSASKLTFSRTHIQTASTIWDVTQTNRAPAANEQILVADQINYSMNLTKSP